MTSDQIDALINIVTLHSLLSFGQFALIAISIVALRMSFSDPSLRMVSNLLSVIAVIIASYQLVSELYAGSILSIPLVLMSVNIYYIYSMYDSRESREPLRDELKTASAVLIAVNAFFAIFTIIKLFYIQDIIEINNKHEYYHDSAPIVHRKGFSIQ